LNQGVRAAQGEYLAFLSADDVWVPQKLEWQIQALAEHPDREMVFGHMQHFFSPELDDVVKSKLHCPPEPMAAYAAGTLLIARETFLHVGLFNEQYRAGEFMDWHARATDHGLKSWLMPQVVSMRRVHDANHTVRTAKIPSNYAAVLQACLARRRTSTK
jgi:hypothetical protein